MVHIMEVHLERSNLPYCTTKKLVLLMHALFAPAMQFWFSEKDRRSGAER
jgi:hypothetical protein